MTTQSSINKIQPLFEVIKKSNVLYLAKKLFSILDDYMCKDVV